MRYIRGPAAAQATKRESLFLPGQAARITYGNQNKWHYSHIISGYASKGQISLVSSLDSKQKLSVRVLLSPNTGLIKRELELSLHLTETSKVFNDGS